MQTISIGIIYFFYRILESSTWRWLLKDMTWDNKVEDYRKSDKHPNLWFMALILESASTNAPIINISAANKNNNRLRALERIYTALNMFESRLISDQRIRKRHFTDIRVGLASSFIGLWRVDAVCMQRRVKRLDGQDYWNWGWCSYCQGRYASRPDYLYRLRHVRLWGNPPPSATSVRWYCIEYSLAVLLSTFVLNHAQLTALTIVSRNDYNWNIHSLGPATNCSIVKSTEHAGNDRKDHF